MKKIKLYSKDSIIFLDQLQIEKMFETYLREKATTKDGALWLSGFKPRGLVTTLLIMHFIHDKDWLNSRVDDMQEAELLHFLEKVKERVFKELFN